MKSRLQVAAAVLLAASFVVANAQTGTMEPHARKHAKAHAPQPTVKEQIEDQINALRQEMQGQIDSLKSNLAEKDAELKQAQQSAADAQAAAAKAQQSADAQQQSYTENSTAVSTLQSTVADLKNNQASLAGTISDETSAIKKEISAPEALHYKGITISPAGSFLAAETVWRSGATGGGLNTQFTGVPLANSDAAQLSEFQGSGRQSRLAVKAIGKLSDFTLTGYYEMDWLSAGVTSNNNQSNSYTMRQRQLWADASLKSGWDFSGGQGWSLASETTQGLTRGTEILPSSIDPQYEAGFVWTRQYSFRVSKAFDKKFFIGASAENAEILGPSGSNLPTGELVVTPGNTGGLYNSGNNYSYNYTPDFIAKIAMEPGWGHWELFGIARSFRDRIYPATFAAGTVTACGTATAAAPCNHVTWGGGVGGGFRGPLFNKRVTVGLKGLYGDGTGRYGSSTIADVTIRPNGALSPIHSVSALSTIEMNPTSRLNVYLNYGGDLVYRDFAITSAGTNVGYGVYNATMSGCNTEPSGSNASGIASSNPSAPSGCSGNTKDVQEFTAGWWYNIYAGPKGRLRQGFQYSLMRRDLWSGIGGPLNLTGGAHGDDNMWYTSFRYYLP